MEIADEHVRQTCLPNIFAGHSKSQTYCDLDNSVRISYSPYLYNKTTSFLGPLPRRYRGPSWPVSASDLGFMPLDPDLSGCGAHQLAVSQDERRLRLPQRGRRLLGGPTCLPDRHKFTGP
jgi:hypothetical protein